MERDPDPAAEFDIEIDSPVTSVWEALTTPDGIASWMGEGASIDPRPGGGISVPDEVTGTPRRGQVLRVEHERRIDFSWWPEDRPDEETVVTITVLPVPGGSRVHIIETVPAALAASRVVATADWAWRSTLLANTRSLRLAGAR